MIMYLKIEYDRFLYIGSLVIASNDRNSNIIELNSTNGMRILNSVLFTNTQNISYLNHLQ